MSLTELTVASTEDIKIKAVPKLLSLTTESLRHSRAYMSNENTPSKETAPPDKRESLASALRASGTATQASKGQLGRSSQSNRRAADESNSETDVSTGHTDSTTSESDLTVEFQPRPLSTGGAPPDIQYTSRCVRETATNPMKHSSNLMSDVLSVMKKSGDVCRIGWIAKAPIGIKLRSADSEIPDQSAPTCQYATPVSDAYEQDMDLVTDGVCDEVVNFGLCYDVKVPQGVNLVALPPAYHLDRSCILPTMVVGPDDPRDKFHPVAPRIRTDTGSLIRRNTPVTQLVLIEDIAPTVDSLFMGPRQTEVIEKNDEKVMAKYRGKETDWYRTQTADIFSGQEPSIDD